MKPKPTLTFAAALLTALFLPLVALAQSTGTITGRVFINTSIRSRRRGGTMTKSSRSRGPTFTFDYSNAYFGNKLGVALNGAFTTVFKEQFRHSLTHDYTSAQAVAANSPLITAINFKDGPKMTDKASGGLKLDYEPFKGLRFTLASSYTWFSDEIAKGFIGAAKDLTCIRWCFEILRCAADVTQLRHPERSEGSHGQ